MLPPHGVMEVNTTADGGTLKSAAANVHMCYDYAYLDNLSDKSAYRNHNVQQCKMQIL